MRTDKTKRNVFLYFSALSVNLASFTAGGAFGWSSPVIPKLNGQIDSSDNPLDAPINQLEESWIGSILLIGAAIGCFLSGFLANRIGRKKTLLLFALPSIIGFIVNAFAFKVEHFYGGRILNGLGIGSVYTVTPMYLGEIAEKTNRGVLGCFCLLFVTAGTILTFCVGPYVTVKALSLINVVPPVLFLMVFGLMVPESPYYWVMRGDVKEARKSLMKLRGNDEDVVVEELPQIRKDVAEALSSKGCIRDLFCERKLQRALLITLGLVTFQQVSGVNFIFFYMQSIFEKTGSVIPSDVSVMVIGFVQTFAVVIASLLVDRMGRRVLLLSSTSGMAVFSLVFGVYFFLKESDHNVDAIYWLPILGVIFYVFAYAIGLGPVPLAMIGEVFPPHVKSPAATLSIFVYLTWAFCVTSFFPLFAAMIGMAYTLFMCAFFCCLGCGFVYFIVPETKGRSFSEIQDMLRN